MKQETNFVQAFVTMAVRRPPLPLSCQDEFVLVCTSWFLFQRWCFHLVSAAWRTQSSTERCAFSWWLDPDQHSCWWTLSWNTLGTEKAYQEGGVWWSNVNLKREREKKTAFKTFRTNMCGQWFSKILEVTWGPGVPVWTDVGKATVCSVVMCLDCLAVLDQQ